MRLVSAATPSSSGGFTFPLIAADSSVRSIDAQIFGKPEIFVSFSAKKLDEKTVELTDQPTIDIVKQQLLGFEKFIRRVNGRH